MSCDKFKEMILDSILDEQDSKNYDTLQNHIHICDDCRLEYKQLYAAVEILRPESNEGMRPGEKLELENRIFNTQLQRLSIRDSRAIVFKRLAAVAAAFIFFFIGFLSRSFYQEGSNLKGRASMEEGIEGFIKQQLSDSSGQRVSH